MPKYGHRRQIPLPPGMFDARSPVEFSAKILRTEYLSTPESFNAS